MALLINPYRFATSSYTPASLFQNGTYKGYWVDASDLSTLKQNSNGTTDVASDNDPVGYVAEKSGAGGTLIQATSGQRPLHRAGDDIVCHRVYCFLGDEAHGERQHQSHFQISGLSRNGNIQHLHRDRHYLACGYRPRRLA
jgi:hypothetical protein